ncbi:MAG: hypothetical protein WCL17_02570 [Actinomycetota bacterium]
MGTERAGGATRIRAWWQELGSIRWAVLILVVQFVAMCLWSLVLLWHYSESVDFAMRYQAWWKIAHGHFNPYTTPLGRSFISDHFELLNWPFAPLANLWPHMGWILWVQNAFVLSAECGAIAVIHHYLPSKWWPTEWRPTWVITITAAVLALSPWTWYTVSNDVHYQTSAAMGLSIWFLYFGLKKQWFSAGLFALLTFSVADVSGTYIVALALSLAIIHRKSLRTLLILAMFAVAGVLWGSIATMFHGSVGSNFAVHYGYLLGPKNSYAVKHGTMLKVLEGIIKNPLLAWSHFRTSISSWISYNSTAGFLGFLNPISILPQLVMVQTGLSGKIGRLATIPWETFPATLTMVPASILTWAWLVNRTEGRFRHLATKYLPWVLIANTAMWSVVWLPHVQLDYARMPSSTAASLAEAKKYIAPNDAVFASFGIIGMYSDRKYDFKLGVSHPDHFWTKTTDFVVVPWSAIENLYPAQHLALVTALDQLPGSRMPVHQNGAFLVQTLRSPTLQDYAPKRHMALQPIAMWLSQGTNQAQRCFDVNNLCTVSDGRKTGTINYGLTWNLATGNWHVHMDIQSTAPLTVEFWDNTTNTLLIRKIFENSVGNQDFNYHMHSTGKPLLYTGWGPYQFRQIPPGDLNDPVELRIMKTGPGTVKEGLIQITRIRPKKR